MSISLPYFVNGCCQWKSPAIQNHYSHWQWLKAKCEMLKLPHVSGRSYSHIKAYHGSNFLFSYKAFHGSNFQGRQQYWWQFGVDFHFWLLLKEQFVKYCREYHTEGSPCCLSHHFWKRKPARYLLKYKIRKRQETLLAALPWFCITFICTKIDGSTWWCQCRSASHSGPEILAGADIDWQNPLQQKPITQNMVSHILIFLHMSQNVRHLRSLLWKYLHLSSTCVLLSM